MTIQELLSSLDELHRGHVNCAPTYELHDLGAGDPRALVEAFLVDAGSVELQPIADWRPVLRQGVGSASGYCGQADDGEVDLIASSLVGALDAELVAPIGAYALAARTRNGSLYFGPVGDSSMVLVGGDGAVVLLGIGWSA